METMSFSLNHYTDTISS